METVNKEELKQRRKESIETFKQEKMKNEAIKQMRLAHFKDEVVQEFEKNNIIYVTHLGNDLIKADKIAMKSVKILEEKHKDIIIYHIEKRKTDNRLFYHYFYINTKFQNRVITEVRYF